MVRRGLTFNIQNPEALENIWATVIAYLTVFHDQPFTFGDAKIIQVYVPIKKYRVRQVQELLASLSDVKQFNLGFYDHSEWSSRFFRTVAKWAPFMQNVKILRIKYKLYNSDVSISSLFNYDYILNVFSWRRKVSNLLGPLQMHGPTSYAFYPIFKSSLLTLLNSPSSPLLKTNTGISTFMVAPNFCGSKIGLQRYPPFSACI